MNSSATPHKTFVQVLRDPDRRVSGDREVRLVWDLGPDPDGGTRQAVLALGHHKKRRGGSFTATLLSQTERDDGTQLTCPLTDWTRVADLPAARYSERQLEESAGIALAALRAQLALADSSGLGRLFEVAP